MACVDMCSVQISIITQAGLLEDKKSVMGNGGAEEDVEHIYIFWRVGNLSGIGGYWKMR